VLRRNDWRSRSADSEGSVSRACGRARRAVRSHRPGFGPGSLREGTAARADGRGLTAHDGRVKLSFVVLVIISGWALLSIIVALVVAALIEPRERADMLADQRSVEDERRRHDVAS
jgi:hypothetical protein